MKKVMTAKDILWAIGAPIISVIVLIAVWELADLYFDLTIFPPPSKFISYLVDEGFSIGFGAAKTTILSATLASFYRVLCGLSISFALALIVGMLISSNKITSNFLLPLVQIGAPIAPIAWIPFAILLFGIGDSTAVFIVFMGTIFVLTLATVASVKSINPNLIRVASTLGASGWNKWRHVIFPAVLPSVFTLLRVNFIAAWMAVLAAEMVGLRDGLGAIIMLGREMFNPNLILVGMTLIGFSGYLLDSLLLFIQRKFLWWNAQVH